MKVVLVSRHPEKAESPRGGVESVTVLLAQALSQLPDVSVHVLTLERDYRLLGETWFGAVKVRRLPRSSWPMLLDVHTGPTRRRLEAAIAAIDPDVVHFHETWGLGNVPTPCAQLFTVHGFDSENLPAEAARFSWLRSKVWGMAERRGFRKARHLVSISPYVTQRLRVHATGEIHEIENPVDAPLFDLKREDEPGRVLCVGWISPRKNTLTSVRAFRQALLAGCATRLVLAGTASDDQYLTAVRREIANCRPPESVELVGQLNREQLKLELQRASVLLLPSLQENAPMAIAEAMAAGVPVIASNRCGMPFMVENEKSGFLVEPADEAQIAERLTTLLGNARLRHSMGARSREIASERFHPSEVARKTLRVYRRIIEQRYQAGKRVAAQQGSAELPR